MDAICLIESSSSDDDDENDDDDDDTPTKGGNEKQRTRRDDDVETRDTRTGGAGVGDLDRDNNNNNKKPRIDCSSGYDETTRKPARGSISIVSQKTGKIVVVGSTATTTTSPQGRDDLSLQQQQEEEGQSVSVSSMFSRSVPHRRGYWSGHVKIPLLLHKVIKLPRPPTTTTTKSSSSNDDKDKIASDSGGVGGVGDCDGSGSNYMNSSSDSSTGDDDDDDYSAQQLSLMKQISRHVRKSTVEFKTWLEDRGHAGYVMEHDDPSHHLHISLSKYFSISIANIEPFMKQLEGLVQDARLTRTRITISCGGGRGAVRNSNSNSNSNRNFDTMNDRRPTILVNDERTRSFWCWDATASRSNETLVRQVKLVDTVLRRYNQPIYYQPPTFHVSVASFAGDLTDDILHQTTNSSNNNDNKKNHTGSSSSSQSYRDEAKKSVNDEEKDDDDDDDDTIVVTVDRIVCTFGTTKEFVINLL